MAAMRSLMVASSVAFALACQDVYRVSRDAYMRSMWGVSIGGLAVGILAIVLTSLPLCRGVLKQHGKVLAAISIVLGVLAMFFPLFGALVSCAPFVDAACNDACTPCTDEEKKIWASACQTLGIIFVYLVVFGWAACVLGVVGASLACCVCCQCCKAKLDDPTLLWEQQRQHEARLKSWVGMKDTGTRRALKGSDAVLESDAPNARLVDSSWQCPGGNRSVLQFVGSFLSILKAVVPIRLNSGDLVMNMNVDMAAMRSLMVASSVAFALACQDVNGFDQDAYAASLWGGSIGGMVVGILVIVLMSLPLCCGVLKQYGKVLGAIGIVLGVLALVIPLFGALGSCVPFVDAACNDACTPCTDEEKKIWASACQTLGIIFVYLVVFGWAACVLGIVGASLACCVCCQCCKAKLDDPAVKQGAPPVVVGTAAPA
ncbi:unnamed protein product [Cladocopium goreaui]|uniref:S-formylglutathione hydrolase n=1 Tax=Cladocopium goreaui TaxID=2562237 RepID=A0A9P1DXQ1_9DINO|nr:unnamed protein product [Cladocopium goreaui]